MTAELVLIGISSPAALLGLFAGAVVELHQVTDWPTAYLVAISWRLGWGVVGKISGRSASLPTLTVPEISLLYPAATLPLVALARADARLRMGGLALIGLPLAIFAGRGIERATVRARAASRFAGVATECLFALISAGVVLNFLRLVGVI